MIRERARAEHVVEIIGDHWTDRPNQLKTDFSLWCGVGKFGKIRLTWTVSVSTARLSMSFFAFFSLLVTFMLSVFQISTMSLQILCW